MSTETLNPSTASSKAILRAAAGLYEVALMLRGAPIVTPNDVTNYLAPGLRQISRALEVQMEIAKSPPPPASETAQAAARLIQKGPDREADFLRAANSGATIHVAQFDGAKNKQRVGDV